jgi:hypothetical protein
MAVEVLKSKGVPEDRILFINLIASPTGVAGFAQRFPKLRVVTAFIDQGLNEKKLASPVHMRKLGAVLTFCPKIDISSPDWGILETDIIPGEHSCVRITFIADKQEAKVHE